MNPLKIMIVAGEASGDILAAELVRALQTQNTETPAGPNSLSSARTQPIQFFGAGGPAMAAAGVQLEIDLTQHAVVGLWEALRKYPFFKRVFHKLLQTALSKSPAAVVLVDFSGFNRRFARALRASLRQRAASAIPKIIYYVSPQVWASRPGRAKSLESDLDLLLSIFPFEKQWYAQHAPALPVEFVGHPILDRYRDWPPLSNAPDPSRPEILLLPGSRLTELKRHLPVMIDAAAEIAAAFPVRFKMILPTATLADAARSTLQRAPFIHLQTGDLPTALSQATIAIASTGTVTLECAYFGLPTVAIYKTSWSTYHIAKRIIQVKHLAMPNLLAERTVYPELVQDEASARRISQITIELLRSPEKRAAIKQQLGAIISSLGSPSASQRAASLILRTLPERSPL